MLAPLDPVPTGLITAILGRARVLSSAITERIGPSPRQMRELTEGRGLFSPYKLNRVSELTRVPEHAIRGALDRINEMIDAIGLTEGALAEHPRLGLCEVVEAGPLLTIRTPKGGLVEGVHPASFAGPDLLDRFGLTPEPTGGETGAGGAIEATATGQPPHAERPSEPAMKPEPDPPAETAPQNGTSSISDDKETSLMFPEPAPEPDVSPAPSTPDAVADEPRDRLRALIDRSGLSQAALSRALGKDPSFLNAILTRGRRIPEDLFDRLTPLCGPDAGEVGPELSAGAHTAAPPLSAVEGADLSPDPAARSGTAPAAEEADTGPAGPGPTGRGADRLILLPPDPPGPDAPVLEVLLDGGCRVRVPEGFDMEAAARLIRSLAAGSPALEGA